MDNELPIMKFDDVLREKTLSCYEKKYLLNAPLSGIDISNCEFINSTGQLFIFRIMLRNKKNVPKFRVIYNNAVPIQGKFIDRSLRIIENIQPIDVSTV